MKYNIAAYGLTKDQELLLEATLPGKYGLTAAECVTDLIVGNPVCTIIDVVDMSEDFLRILLSYYMDVNDRLDETVVWLGNADLPKLPSFVCCDNFLDLLPELENIISKAQARYDTMQMYNSEYAYLPKHAVEESIEADINTALHRKYGTNPDPRIVERVRRELTTLREVDASQNTLQDLAAVYELSRWLKAQNIPFYVRHGIASGFIPYILGITHTNPLPPHTFCPECKELHWNHDYKDGFDIPAANCPNCGKPLIRDGHNLVWQQFCGYGPVPSYVFWLPLSAQSQISSWIANHWRKHAWETDWEPIEEQKGRIIAGPCCMLFAFDEADIQTDFYKQTITADQTEELIRLVGSEWQKYDGIGLPYPKNAAEAIVVYEFMEDSGVRNKCAKYLLHCGLGISDLICCREDIFYYLRDHGFTEKDAIRGMNYVHKGKGFPVITGEMRNAHDKWVLKQCEHVECLSSRSEDWEWLFFQLRCGWAPSTYSGLSTGIDVLDHSILGMQPGEVILVAARPAMGKTSFARGVQAHLDSQGKRMFHFNSLCDGKEAYRHFADFERMVRESNADIAVLDHFQWLLDYDETDDAAECLFERIKSLATELHIPIMVLVHLNRGPETRSDPSPIKRDIPHVEKILPLIDTVLLLYRRAYYDPIADQSSARFILRKAKRCKYKYKILTPKWDDENLRFTD